jgi:hypothetical protein
LGPFSLIWIYLWQFIFNDHNFVLKKLCIFLCNFIFSIILF